MTTPLADRLNAARQARFVGRESEREVFRSALLAKEPSFHLLFVSGPGGIGKTTLLGEFMRICTQAKIPAILLDAHNLDPTPESFSNALRFAMDLGPDVSPLEALASSEGRRVLLLDTYEVLAPLDGWIRESFLPLLPEGFIVVLAGRQPASPAWRADAGWQSLLQPMSLRNLAPEESRDYLERRAIPSDQHQAVLDFTHGHPLALSLVADSFDQREGVSFQPEDAPDLVKTLLERFTQKVPGPAHRAALEACCLVRLTTEPLLAEMLESTDVREVFEWLRGLSFIESGRLGVFPHDLAREALLADLRWRNPDWYAELHRRARTYYGNRLQQTKGPEQQLILYEYIFLHRENPVVRPFFQWQLAGAYQTEMARESDHAAIKAMVAQHEGKESAAIAQRWLSRFPHSFMVIRDEEKAPVGTVAMIPLHEAKPEDLKADPGLRAAWEYLQKQAPLRSGEAATHFRFWMARDTYQEVSAIQSLLVVNIVQHYLTAPGLAYTFLPCAQAEFWEPAFTYADLKRIPEADYEIGGRHYGIYGHDWRRVPPLAWLTLLAEREMGVPAEAGGVEPASETLLVLSEIEFADAVKEALRSLTRPDALRTNPLLRARMVVEKAGSGAGRRARVQALQQLIEQVAVSLKSTPRDVKHYRALHVTYLHPLATQELAAEKLNLPFSTYRRHLTGGVQRLSELLWHMEIGDI